VSVDDKNLSKVKVAYFSNENDKVKICAPGVDVASTIIGDGYGTWDGTSQSSPHVSAMLAILAQKIINEMDEDIEGSSRFCEILTRELKKSTAPVNGKKSISYGEGFLCYNESKYKIPIGSKMYTAGKFIGWNISEE